VFNFLKRQIDETEIAVVEPEVESPNEPKVDERDVAMAKAIKEDAGHLIKQRLVASKICRPSSLRDPLVGRFTTLTNDPLFFDHDDPSFDLGDFLIKVEQECLNLSRSIDKWIWDHLVASAEQVGNVAIMFSDIEKADREFSRAYAPVDKRWFWATENFVDEFLGGPNMQNDIPGGCNRYVKARSGLHVVEFDGSPVYIAPADHERPGLKAIAYGCERPIHCTWEVGRVKSRDGHNIIEVDTSKKVHVNPTYCRTFVIAD